MVLPWSDPECKYVLLWSFWSFSCQPPNLKGKGQACYFVFTMAWTLQYTHTYTHTQTHTPHTVLSVYNLAFWPGGLKISRWACSDIGLRLVRCSWLQPQKAAAERLGHMRCKLSLLFPAWKLVAPNTPTPELHLGHPSAVHLAVPWLSNAVLLSAQAALRWIIQKWNYNACWHASTFLSPFIIISDLWIFHFSGFF